MWSMDELSMRLVGATEIRDLMHGISRQRVYQLTKHKDFPEPAASLAQGKVWLADEVETWLAQRRAANGTPRPRARKQAAK